MKIGMTFWFQNQEDYWARAKPDDFSKPMPVPDAKLFRETLALADMAETCLTEKCPASVATASWSSATVVIGSAGYGVLIDHSRVSAAAFVTKEVSV